MKLFASFQAQPLLQSKNIQWALKILASVILLGLCLCLFALLLYKIPMKNTVEQKAEQQQTLIVLNHLEAKVNQLAVQIAHLDQNKAKEEIISINAHLNNIEQTIDQLNSVNSIQLLQEIITQSHDEVINKVAELQQQIQHLKKQLIPPAYLPVSKLPFKVISIDIWNGTPQATIQLNRTADLMAQNDTRSGWTLITINFDPAYVIFKNTRNQRIKVDLST
jgi:uncharacterized protein YlzI (FlbEa/FlbD family)